MQFFLHEIVARLVAIYLCFDCGQKLWYGFVERKIVCMTHGFLDWTNFVADRDTMPVLYWMEVGLYIITVLACLVVAIFGWWQPSA